MTFLTSLIQKTFFKGMKSEPGSRWIQRAASQGNYSEFNIYRERKKIACYLLERSVRSSCDDKDPVVVFSHPISRKAKFFFTDSGRASIYLKRGLSVLAFDYNGFSQSEIIDLYYWKDVVAVLDYLKIQYPERKIILQGTSFGAFHIIRAMQYLPPGSSVVLGNVNKSLLSYWQRWPLMGILLRVLMLAGVRPVLDMDVRSVIRSFARSDIHIQFIACEDDELTTLAEIRELYDELGTTNKTFTVFAGAGHLEAPVKDPHLYQSALFGEVIDYAQ